VYSTSILIFYGPRTRALRAS